MQHARAWPDHLPDDSPRSLLHADKAWRARGGNPGVGGIKAIAGADHEQIPDANDGAIGRFVRIDSQVHPHVEFPNQLRCLPDGVGRAGRGRAWLAAGGAADSQAPKLRLRGDIVEAVFLDERGAGRHRLEEVVKTAR